MFFQLKWRFGSDDSPFALGDFFWPVELIAPSCPQDVCVLSQLSTLTERITDHGTGMNFWDKLDDPELAKKRVSAAKALFECLGLSMGGMDSFRSRHPKRRPYTAAWYCNVP